MTIAFKYSVQLNILNVFFSPSTKVFDHFDWARTQCNPKMFIFSSNPCHDQEYQQIKLLPFDSFTWPKLSRLHFSFLAVKTESFCLANGLTLRLVALSLGDLRSGAYTVTYCLSFFHVILFSLTYSSNALTHSPVTVCIDPTCTLCIFCAFHSLTLLCHVEADSI